MTPLLRESVYSPRYQTALADARAREDAREREAIQRATTCGWCGDRITPGERCRKRMCQCEQMGDSPSDYR